LGEGLPAKEKDGRIPFAPRWLKDVVRNGRSRAGATLFTRVDLVFMDTTCPYSEGAGGRHGYSRDR